ncbi:hypothetical protein B0H10DRAFT_2009001 [Mycena sp. CBHHK59/15]|nr:hypothetical protein B0H10DRAFT_2009001 [Mycena sp. CBHHK59/15]
MPPVLSSTLWLCIITYSYIDSSGASELQLARNILFGSTSSSQGFPLNEVVRPTLHMSQRSAGAGPTSKWRYADANLATSSLTSTAAAPNSLPATRPAFEPLQPRTNTQSNVSRLLAMARPVSSSDSSADDYNFQNFKASQAEQFRAPLNVPPSTDKFKEAQADGLRAESIRNPSTSPKKPRTSTKGSRARSTPHHTPASLLNFLASDVRDTKDTRRLLHTALAQLDASAQRLAQSDAERRALESSQLAHATHSIDAASAAHQSAAAVQAELSMSKLQIAHAAQEIARAQDVVRTLQVQRDDAERAATHARKLARKLHVQNRVLVAREQGRREGYETGFGHGRLIAIAREQRRIDAEAARRQIRAPPAAANASEHGGAFIEEHDSSSEGEDRQRGVRQFSSQQQGTGSSERSSQPRPVETPAPPPIPAVPDNNQLPRRPASGMSSSSRRVSAPAASQQQQQQAPRSRTTSSTGSRAGRSSVVVGNRNSTSTATQNRNSFPAQNAAPTATNGVQRPRRRSTANNFELDPGRRPMSLAEAMMPRMPVPPPRMSIPAPAPLQQHIPMPPPPIGMGTMPPPPMRAPPPQPQFVVERPHPPPHPHSHPQTQNEVERREQTRSPSSVATSLHTLHLTSFPTVADSSAAREREPGGVGRERELSVILEDVDGGSPGGGMHVNGWDNAAPPPARQQTPWGNAGQGQGQPSWGAGQGQGQTQTQSQTQTSWGTPARSTPYSDPREMEEWRRGTDEEAPRNVLPPPSPVTSPGMLSPFDVRPNHNVNQQRSQESMRTDLHRSSSGSSSHTVNITIVPPSRPSSLGNSTGLPADPGFGTSGFLSPNHVHDTPVVPDSDSEEEDDEDDDDDESEEVMPPGVVISPLPAFARGATDYPPGFVPLSVAPARAGMGGTGAAWSASAPPPLIGANNPNPNSVSSWPPSAVGGPPRPSSSMGGIIGATGPAYVGPGATGGGPPRPPSSIGGSIGAAPTWGAPTPNGVGATGLSAGDPPRPRSSMGGVIGATPGWTAPPLMGANAPVASGPSRPLSSMGGRATPSWTAPPLIGANGPGPSRPPSQMGGGAPGSNWNFGGQYTFGQTPTPAASAALPLGFVATSTAAPVTTNAPLSPQPTRPISFIGTPRVDNVATPRPPLYGPPLPGASDAFATGYAPTPGRAAGFPLPASASASSPAMATPHQRMTSLYAGGTPAAAFGTRPLGAAVDYRPASRASSSSRGGFPQYTNNQTPNPNRAVTNPYTGAGGDVGASGSSGTSGSTLGLGTMTAHNTFANANPSGGVVIPVIPPSPAHSYRPLR